jgi:hypothetical protein
MLYPNEKVSKAVARRALTAARGENVALPRFGYEILLFRYGAPCRDQYGAWDETELADDAQNKARILWIACCDFRAGEDLWS